MKFELTFDIEKSKTRCLECGFECSDELSEYTKNRDVY